MANRITLGVIRKVILHILSLQSTSLQLQASLGCSEVVVSYLVQSCAHLYGNVLVIDAFKALSKLIPINWSQAGMKLKRRDELL